MRDAGKEHTRRAQKDTIGKEDSKEWGELYTKLR